MSIMRRLFLLLALISFVLFPAASCGTYRITKEMAEEIALREANAAASKWLIMQTRKDEGAWIVVMKLPGDNCNLRTLYIDRRTGEVLEERGGNEC